jgi:twinkle protein
MEINGFKIETHNQYNLDERAKYSTCPLCSENRRKKTEKCAMLDWKTGLGTCAHCGETFQLHTYVKRGFSENKKQYAVPEKYNKTKLSDKAVKWFEQRGISQLTLVMMKVGEGVEYMPQRGEKVNTLQFNYFAEGELVNIKYRDSRKNFKLFKDARLILYNLDGIKINTECVVVEGEIDQLSYFEAGIYNCVSVPNGANRKTQNLEYIDNCVEYFENKEKIYLALDNDEPGQACTKELIRRLGSERCYTVDLKDCKDANEYLLKYGKE